MHREQHGRGGEQRDGREIRREVVPRLRVQAHVDGVGVGAEHDRVAVGRGARRLLGADIAARPGAVVDHDLLPEDFREALPDDARDDVAVAAGRVGHDEAHGLGRIAVVARGLRVSGRGGESDKQ